MTTGALASSDGAALTAQLADTWQSTGDLLASLTPEEWRTPTGCPGWDVQAQAAHIVGTEASLLGRPLPPVPETEPPGRVRNDLARINEAWVAAMAPLDRTEMLAQWHEVIDARLAALRAMTEADWSAPSWTPVGEGTYAQFMQIRVFDCWSHEQDIRRAVGRPGGESGPAAVGALDQLGRGLGYAIGKLGGAPAGSAVTIVLTGPAARTWHVAVEGRAALVESLDRPADVVIEAGAVDFAAIAGGREGAADLPVTLSGDTALGRQILSRMAFTI